MAIDEAGTLEPGEATLDVGLERIDDAHGFFGAAAYAPLAGLEAELAFGHARDRSAAAIETIDVAGVALKWVPLRSAQGLSAGLKIGYLDEREKGGADSSVRTLEVLLHWETRSGALLVANLGRASVHEQGSGRRTIGTWGVGLDMPVGHALSFTVETFGAEGSGPDRQLGLRYRFAPNLALWVAGGRGNDASFASLGLTWVF